MKGLRIARSMNASKGPAGMVLDGESSPEGAYLFDDGTIGYISEPEFCIDDYLDEGEEPEDLETDGMMPIGNIFIDRWRPGETIEGGCFLYYKGETLADYCGRNGEPLPMRRIPEEAYYLAVEGRLAELEGYLGEVPELKGII